MRNVIIIGGGSIQHDLLIKAINNIKLQEDIVESNCEIVFIEQVKIEELKFVAESLPICNSEVLANTLLDSVETKDFFLKDFNTDKSKNRNTEPCKKNKFYER